MSRDDDLNDALLAYLERKVPPPHLAKNPAAHTAEIAALAGAVLRRAPAVGYLDWWDTIVERLDAASPSRIWPTVGDVIKAITAPSPHEDLLAPEPTDAADERGADMLASWFAKFKDQMPSMGNSRRTAILIRRGVLANEREAKFYGFDLDPHQDDLARDQPMGQAEIDTDRRVRAKLELWRVDGELRTPPNIAALAAAKRMPTGAPETPRSHLVPGAADDPAAPLTVRQPTPEELALTRRLHGLPPPPAPGEGSPQPGGSGDNPAPHGAPGDRKSG